MIAALVVAGSAAITAATPVQAAYAPRVVIVVGPSGSATSDYLGKARSYAAQAKAYGAQVSSILHPRATWSRVVSAAQGANIFIYLGHGNGWPSPYAPFQTRTKDGMGLNPYDGAGAGKVAYYGEGPIRDQIRLAPGAIVLFNRLCYASGNGEPGMAEPSWSTAVKRVDNYAAGFLSAGAAAVLADGHTSLGWELAMLFGPSRSLVDTWKADPDANGHVRSFASSRTAGVTLRLDPDRANAGFYRSLATRSDVSTGGIRTPAYWGTAKQRLTLRSSPSAAARSVASLGDGTRYVVRGSLVTDGSGRTWAPVTTRTGRRGFVAAWMSGFSGSAKTATRIVLRARPSTNAGRLALVGAGRRVTVLGSTQDGRQRAWLKVRIPSGRTGWIAAWLTRP